MCNLDLGGFYWSPEWSGKIDSPYVVRYAASRSSTSFGYELLTSSLRLFDYDFSDFFIFCAYFALTFAIRFFVAGEFGSFSFTLVS